MSRIFSLIFTLLFCLSSFAFAQEGDIFAVADVPVNVEDETPTKARNLAINTAHRNAFLILLERLELDAEIAEQVSDEEIFNMVISRHIGGEKLSGNNYSANFNITFGEDFVEQALSEKDFSQGEGIEAETPRETYLLIPVKIEGAKALLWEENNDWKRAVARVLASSSGDKLILPYSDIENIATVNRGNVFSSHYSNLEPMILRYGAKGVYLLFFTDDKLENKTRVDISYIAKLQTKKMKLSFVNVKNVKYDSLVAIVARKTIEYVDDLKVHDFSKVGDVELSLNVKISNLGDWLTAKNQIENSGLISQLNIKSISRDNVVIEIKYTGTNSDIIKVFADKGIVLQQGVGDSYIFKAN
jgi:hypothetical protein